MFLIYSASITPFVFLLQLSTPFFCFSWIHYCNLPIKNSIMVSRKIAFMKTYLVMRFFWFFLSFSKIAVCAFMAISSSAKLCDDTTIILLTTNPTLYQIYHHFRIATKSFLYLINFIWMFTFEGICIFHAAVELTRRSISTAWFGYAYLINIWKNSSHQI